MRIRPATPADAGEIAASHIDAWRVGYRGVMPDAYLDGLSVDRFAANWSQVLDDPDGPTVLVGVLDDEVAGFVVVGPSRDDAAAPGAGELWSLNLASAHWGVGHGQALASAGMEALYERGYESPTLWVVVGNERALRTYGRLRWTPDGGTRSRAVGEAQISEMRLQVDLHPPGPHLVEDADDRLVIDGSGPVDDDLMYRLRDADRQRGAPLSSDI